MKSLNTWPGSKKIRASLSLKIQRRREVKGGGRRVIFFRRPSAQPKEKLSPNDTGHWTRPFSAFRRGTGTRWSVKRAQQAAKWRWVARPLRPAAADCTRHPMAKGPRYWFSLTSPGVSRPKNDTSEPSHLDFSLQNSLIFQMNKF